MKGHSSSTLTTDLFPGTGDTAAHGPGLVMVFSVNRPAFTPVPILPEPTLIGRKAEAGICLPLDSRMSRTHARIVLQGDRIEIVDLDSHNGTFVDGERVAHVTPERLPRTLRVGDTVFIFVPDIAPFLNRTLEIEDGVVVGPTLALLRDRLAQLGQAGSNVLLTGETGVGKELAARHFHAMGDKGTGPLVAVNCATIPPALAERLLFGAQRGAYSGADANVDGYVQTADGGTLFLDEIAELEPAVQAKLLRVLETKEVLPLGATRPRIVKFALCAATLKNLKNEVEAGRFRADLYHRVGRPEVRIPALRERAEEIPWLAASEFGRVDPKIVPTAPFIDECLLREWPGNVREFLAEMREAAISAKADGRTLLYPVDLTTIDGPRADANARASDSPRPPTHSTEEIIDALRQEVGNVSKAARKLGMHRNQLRRWLTAHGFDVAALRNFSEPPPSLPAAVEPAPPTRSNHHDD
jgi:transcriptional regulator with AAA-type ATPase domain